MRYGGKIDILNSLTTVSIEIDDKLYKRAIEKRYNSSIR